MNDYFQLSIDNQRRVLRQVANQTFLPVQAVEKDLWITTLLQLVFVLPFADKLIFKGGTSLSKVWHLIERFSEDIDLAVDRSLFALDGDLTKKQIKKLRKASSIFVKEDFCKELQIAIQQYGLASLCSIEVQPDGEGDNTYPEPRKLLVRYKSVWNEPLAYLPPVVMLEIGARSLFEPNEQANVRSLVEKSYPAIRTTPVDSKVVTALPGKTFLEKVFLLHELFSTEGHGLPAERKSRHLYDLHKMMDKDFAIAAIKDDDLWESIRHHREIFTSVGGMDYTPDIRQRLMLVPQSDIKDAWEADYNSMSLSMIFGDKPSFSMLLQRMKELENRFHIV